MLERMTERNAAKMRQVLLQARDRTELLIVRYAKKGNYHAAARVRDSLYRDLKDEYVRLQGNIDIWGQRAVKSTAREWRKLAIDDLPPGEYDQTWDQFDSKYLKHMIKEFDPSAPERLAGVNSALSNMLQNDIRTLRAAHADVTLLGAATGITQEEMAREMRRRILKVRPAWQFIDKGGRVWNSRDYFSMLTMTVSANVARESYVDTMAEAGHDLVTIEGGIIAECCEACARWAGEIVSISGKTRGYRTVAQAKAGGVFHPRCRHYYAAVLPGELAAAQVQHAKTQAQWSKRQEAREEAA